MPVECIARRKKAETMDFTRATARTWAEIDLDILLSNYHLALSELSAGVSHYVVLKANAYGFGAQGIAHALYGEGARLFAVACASEALELRHTLPQEAQILIMGATMPCEMQTVLRHGIQITVFTEELARQASAIAQKLNTRAVIHCKVDTGLHRLGFAPEDAADAIARIARMPGLEVTGVFSHLQRRSAEHDLQQAQTLRAVHDDLLGRGVAVPMLHMLDSIGMWRYPQNQFDAVRDAAFILGNTPQDYPHADALRLALSFKTRIVHIHTIPAGEGPGYSCMQPVQKATRAATLCAGYGDGYPRAMSGTGEVEIHGMRAPVLGAVSMDMMTVDIDTVPQARVGDEAILLGGSVDLMSYASFCGGYANECIGLISRRVPRVYIKQGKVHEIMEYI